LAKNFEAALENEKMGEGNKTEIELEKFFLGEICKQPDGRLKWD